MNKLDLIVQFEAENNVVFPNSYKEILRIFNNYIIYDYHITELGIKKTKDLEFYSISRLFENMDKIHKYHQVMIDEVSTQLIDCQKNLYI
ncbi:SMI1/KNR4 family protein [Kingella kingae]|uniref:Uncharacterized protein n=1 Tax=Kingella kingae ATCC 23330 TaxID=887327 RepID=F5S5K9_KINKI|nr:SMI1/KNR4 family protein [Kingella kingae]EGK10980.1 hypothetical protein HMPREF0476_0492 [Kingella kingae ATCC 23330]UOP03706.1 SMI1/KNR4 family protein [Kingella kingae]